MATSHDRTREIAVRTFFAGCIAAVLMVAGLMLVGCQGQVVSGDNPPEQTINGKEGVLQTASPDTSESSAAETQNDQQEFTGAIEYDGAPCH